MHLDFGGKEVPIFLTGESTVRTSSQTGRVIERIKVGVMAVDQIEQQRFLHFIEKAKRIGLNSTDGRGHVMNKWRIVQTKVHMEDREPYRFCLNLDLEELEELA